MSFEGGQVDFSRIISIISDQEEHNVSIVEEGAKDLSENEKIVICICLVLKYDASLTNVALETLRASTEEHYSGFITKFIVENSPLFCDFLPKINSINSRYCHKLIKELANIVPCRSINDLLKTFREKDIQNLSLSAYSHLIVRGKEAAMLDFLDRSDFSEQQQKIFVKIFKNSKCSKFSAVTIAKICFLFLNKTLSIDSEAFGAFSFYFSRKFHIFSYDTAQGSVYNFASLVRQMFTNVRGLRKIIVSKLVEHSASLNDIEIAVLGQTLDDNNLVYFMINAIKNKYPITVVKNLAMRCKEKQLYQNIYNVIFPYFACNSQLDDDNVRVLIENMDSVTQFMYMPLVLSKALNCKRKDLITKYAEFNDIAISLLFMFKVSNTLKESLLKPIKRVFDDKPGDAFTALYLLANSQYISDLNVFKKVIKGISKTCITESFDKRVSNYNFSSKIKKFFKTKYNGELSVQKFLLKIYMHKSNLELSENRIIKLLINLLVRDTPVVDEKTLEGETNQKSETVGNKEPKMTPVETSKLVAPPEEEKQKEEEPVQEKKTWSFFGFLSYFNYSGSSKRKIKSYAENDRERSKSIPENLQKTSFTPSMLGRQRLSSTDIEIPELVAPNDDEISSDQELDFLSDDSESYEESSSSEPLEDLSTQWAN